MTAKNKPQESKISKGTDAISRLSRKGEGGGTDELPPGGKILWPTDFSQPSERALEIASALASHFSAGILAMHVVPGPPIVPPQAGMTSVTVPLDPEKLRDEATGRLRDYLDTRLDPDIPHEVMVETGTPSDLIIERARKADVDMVVMGTHGETGLSRILLGSVTEQVVRNAPKPVLTIRQRNEEKED